ncbi:uncharacterized protein LOC127803763 isoform X2 [Diospyros lotus]|uniref:uncharacterized protein LOC127803763 isoform X2 n=1 Tax=Diospyros lotus TaxID=55363 RepID=UPI00225111BB|nr:uncharacterized protein LOC127803763 isoform X2 [Diospyros lotus]
MNDSSGKTASSLAIAEKRLSRPGGCVGIFCHLFDWNRRFTKTKLFSMKLLPPARPKQSPPKFGGEDKLPKIRLIANENSGGFPNVRKNGVCKDDSSQKPGMKPPGLVARLMGLESMPVVQQQDSPKKGSSIEPGGDKGSQILSGQRGFDEEDATLGKERLKHETQPQKLQKTGAFERQSISRFGAETLQFKSVLSRSRKRHPELASPIKSSRMTSGRNTSRLIDVAARILEPGLQASNKSKCAITYSNIVHRAPKHEGIMEGKMTQSLNLSKKSDYHVTETKSLKENSCKNCGSLLGVADSSPCLEEMPLPFASSVSKYVSPSIHGLERSSMPGAEVFPVDQGIERVGMRSKDQAMPVSAHARNSIKSHSAAIANRKHINQGGQILWHPTSQQCKSQNDVLSSMALKQKNRRQNKLSLDRGQVSLQPNLCNVHTTSVSSAANATNETKDFVGLNRSLSGRTQSRMLVKVYNCKCDMEMKPFRKQDASISPIRKRRSININHQVESSTVGSPSTFGKQRKARHHPMPGTSSGLDAGSVNCKSTKESDVISFAFNSPMKQKVEVNTTHNVTQKTLILDKSERKIRTASFLLSEDALGAFLEQKLKELSIQEEDDLSTGGTLLRKSTAMILQEPATALTSEGPVSQDNVDFGSNGEKISCSSHQHLPDMRLKFQAKEKKAGDSLDYLHGSNHLSPGSVLEVSFSNDSCLSSSVDDCSVAAPNLHSDSLDCSYYGPQPLETEAELLDSATSLRKGCNGHQSMTDLVNQISERLYSISFVDSGLKGSKLAHAKEVMLNAEVFFRNTAVQNSDRSNDFSFTQFLIFELETLARSFCANFGQFPGIEGTKNGNLLKEFLFDCVIEYLDSKIDLYCKSGLKAWTSMTSCANADKLITEIVEEVKKWLHLAENIPDEIIMEEMHHSLGGTDFEIEAYETGAEIDGDLLQILVDEIVVDLCESKHCPSRI